MATYLPGQIGQLSFDAKTESEGRIAIGSSEPVATVAVLLNTIVNDGQRIELLGYEARWQFG